MSKGMIFALFCLGLFSSAATASAQEINARQHLDPALQVKVNKAMARALREEGTAKSRQERSGSGSNCGNLVVGDPGDSNNPSEIIIVAEAIININRNCR